MAEIFRSEGCVVKVFSNDHAPAHVHVTSAEQEIRIDISGPVAVVLESGKKRWQNADARFTKQALRLVNDRLAEIKTAWKSIHNGK
ncbi:DUF4160 domain-containing protein [Romeria aff. gracilis LEGE 07310]|uniref:DUF4160 domain-containing protein n=1 Tax=Vasconcelosia minhoensis LEGE 07310 TaxID=915328 RepID=A0A8J7A571_9CYAN|nr:DUF4160 domain-containing protein [Romeria aff. gracilis LEGE 07310]